MTHFIRFGAAGLGLLAALTAWPARAESLAASTVSSASSAGSASVGSLSDSLQGSSGSSGNERRQTAGDYRLIELAEAPEAPGHLRLRLRPLDQASAQADAPAASPDHDLWLRVPREALATRPLAVGDVVVARDRPYGLWFGQRASDGAQRPFYLALHDDWQRELGARALAL